MPLTIGPDKTQSNTPEKTVKAVPWGARGTPGCRKTMPTKKNHSSREEWFLHLTAIKLNGVKQATNIASRR